MVVLVAHVRRVRQSARRQRFAERNELLARREGAGSVLEPRRRATSAGGERLLDELRHARRFVRRRRPIDVADDDAAYRAQSDHRCHVHTRLQRLERLPELVEARERVPILLGLTVGRGAAGGRARRSVLPDNDRRHALPNDRLGARIVPEGAVAVRMDVDESRRHAHAAGVDLHRPVVLEISANRDDTSAVDRDVRLDPRTADSIEDGPAANDECITTAPGKHQPRRSREYGQRRTGAQDE